MINTSNRIISFGLRGKVHTDALQSCFLICRRAVNAGAHAAFFLTQFQPPLARFRNEALFTTALLLPRFRNPLVTKSHVLFSFSEDLLLHFFRLFLAARFLLFTALSFALQDAPLASLTKGDGRALKRKFTWYDAGDCARKITATGKNEYKNCRARAFTSLMSCRSFSFLRSSSS
jgi:hypothetical protein